MMKNTLPFWMTANLLQVSLPPNHCELMEKKCSIHNEFLWIAWFQQSNARY